MNNQMIQALFNQIVSNSQAMNNPLFASAMNMYRNNDTNGLKQMVDNLCRTKGINVDDIRRQIGI